MKKPKVSIYAPERPYFQPMRSPRPSGTVVERPSWEWPRNEPSEQVKRMAPTAAQFTIKGSGGLK